MTPEIARHNTFTRCIRVLMLRRRDGVVIIHALGGQHIAAPVGVEADVHVNWL